MDLIWSLDAQTFLVFFLVLLLLLSLRRQTNRQTNSELNLPPGPQPWPVVGNVPMIGKNLKKFHLLMQELHQKYGRVFTLWIGPLPTVFVSDLETIKTAFVGKLKIFANRPSWMFLIQRYTPNIGISMASGKPWRDMRRLTVQAIRDLSMERRIQDEAEMMCQEIDKHVGKPYCCTKLFQQALFNVICSVCFGLRYEYDNPELHSVMRMLDDIANDNYFFHPLNFYPLLRLIPLDHFLLKGMDTRNNNLNIYIDGMIDNHEKDFDAENCRDLVDMWLSSQHKGNTEVTRSSLRKAIRDVFAGGTETPSTGLLWLVLFMLHHLDVQARCQQEADQVIGSRGLPCLSDRPKMPFVEATIHEMLRLCSLAPSTLPHESNKDIILEGYHIPAHTLVMANIYSVHRSPKHWEDPETFNPQRWIGKDGSFEKREGFMPSSIGPRTCPGESLGKNELFLLFSTLLLRYNFQPEDRNHLPSIEGFLTVNIAPRDFCVVPVLR